MKRAHGFTIGFIDRQRITTTLFAVSAILKEVRQVDMQG